MRSMDLFLPSVADQLNLRFLNITHCALPYYTGSFHLYSRYTSGEVHMLEPGGYATKT